ncbi:MAG: hypothetical protein WA853_04885 [Candidatus Acidiferrum sp.]
MIHLIQFLLKLVLNAEQGLQDNTKLVGSLFLGGVWLLLLTAIFPEIFGSWREGFYWAGWILVGVAAFLFLRRKIWEKQGRRKSAKRNTLFEA